MRPVVRLKEVNGFSALVLENPRIQVAVLPMLGGRIWELIDVARQRQWIWHRSSVDLRRNSVGSPYDDVWAGGWEELFPNDAPGCFEGRDLPDHGEWWTMSWDAEVVASDSTAVVRMESISTIRSAVCRKEIAIDAESPTVHVRYSIENLEIAPFHFLFKQHLPVLLSDECRLVIPDGTIRAVEDGFGTILPSGGAIEQSAGQRYRAVRSLLMGVPPVSGASREFVYLSELGGGVCGLDDMRARASLRLHFDLQKMPYLWLFLTYGGWRDCFTAVLEPCTNMPKDLAAAKAIGQAAKLESGGQFSTAVSVRLGGM